MSRRMRVTSLLAYSQLKPKLGVRQREVFYTIDNARFPLTDREVARELGYSDPNRVRPRRNELARLGLVVEAGRRVCSVSGKLALTWKARA